MIMTAFASMKEMHEIPLRKRWCASAQSVKTVSPIILVKSPINSDHGPIDDQVLSSEDSLKCQVVASGTVSKARL